MRKMNQHGGCCIQVAAGAGVLGLLCLISPALGVAGYILAIYFCTKLRSECRVGGAWNTTTQPVAPKPVLAVPRKLAKVIPFPVTRSAPVKVMAKAAGK